MLERVTTADGLVFFESPALRALGVPHGFSTRIGPGGNTHFTLASDNDAHMAQFAAALDCPAREHVTVYQVHGACVWDGARVSSPASADELRVGTPALRYEADAITSSDPAQLLAVRTADCVPVLLASSDGSRVAAIHAGWKGLVAGVIPNAVKALLEKNRDREEAGARIRTTPPPSRSGFLAAIGPCMGLAAFEVDEDVAAQFDAAGLGAAVNRHSWPKPHVDLRLAAELQLHQAKAQLIDSEDLCTYRDEHLFFSHRRDRTHRGLPKSGHIAAFIGAKG